VQPLKAFGAIAIAHGLGANEIAAGALLMGGIFVALSATGLLNQAAKIFPRPIIRGVQLSVGLLFCQLAWNLTAAPPAAFGDHSHHIWWLLAGGMSVVLASLLVPRGMVALVLGALTILTIVMVYQGPLTLGPAPMRLPELSFQAFVTAFVLLVVPQLPLTFANSCLATSDAAQTYFGRAAARVQPARLALTSGMANLLAGSISGMPVCHGAGGMTAHYGFGARTGGTPIILGVFLLLLAIVLGESLAGLLASFPLPILAGLLATAGLLHITLLKDLRHPTHWGIALAVGIAGFIGYLAIALLGALLIWWTTKATLRVWADKRLLS